MGPGCLGEVMMTRVQDPTRGGAAGTQVCVVPGGLVVPASGINGEKRLTRRPVEP